MFQGGVESAHAADKRRQSIPHLWNLNEDPALTDVVVHFIPEGEATVGERDILTKELMRKLRLVIR